MGQVLNIGNNQEVSIFELAMEVKQLLNSNSEIVSIPYSQAYGTGFEDLQRRVPDISRIAEVTGWIPIRDRKSMILDTAEFIRSR